LKGLLRLAGWTRPGRPSPSSRRRWTRLPSAGPSTPTALPGWRPAWPGGWTRP